MSTFISLDGDLVNPSEELKHFTNRDAEHADFQQSTTRSKFPLPVLMFFGVGGTGKTWLLKRLRQSLGKSVPTASLDLDPRTGGAPFHTDWSRALAEIRRQFGADIHCPRFDMAYTWLRYKQGNGDEPLFKGSGLLGGTWEFLMEVGDAAIASVPGGNIATWFVRKMGDAVAKRLREIGVTDWLATKLGEEDFLGLKEKEPDEIHGQLHKRLLRDLKEHLPEVEGRACRAVIFLDTIESLRSARHSEEKVRAAQDWVRNLYHPESGVLIVLAGRDRLTWGDMIDSPFAAASYLEQHLVGGLSEPDARDFLTRCSVSEPKLQSAVLRVCRDEETGAQAPSAVDERGVGYHAFSLGLCADTIHNVRRHGAQIAADTFEIPAGDLNRLAERFLRSLGDDAGYSAWLRRLALTPRFDEAAARTSFTPHPGAEQDAAWRTLLGYSFVRPTDERGWWTLHARMREAVGAIQQRSRTPDDDSESGHRWWQQYWTGRSQSPVDESASLAWYHDWRLEPDPALQDWEKLARQARQQRDTAAHQRLLGWWEPCNLEKGLADDASCRISAKALVALSCEWSDSSINPNESLRRAIDGLHAALRVTSEDSLPREWMGIQLDLGKCWSNLRSGDPTANIQQAIQFFEAALGKLDAKKDLANWAIVQNNLATCYGHFDDTDHKRRAIACYRAALGALSEAAHPELWSMAQHGLGFRLAFLESGDRERNLQEAIKCYRAALRIRTKDRNSNDWAQTTHNLGLVLSLSKSGDLLENKRQAIALYESLLEVWNEKSNPVEWARVQLSIADLHLDPPYLDEKKESYRAAPAHCEAALRVLRETGHPWDWARAQENLGRAHFQQTDGDREQNLTRAADCFQAAMRVRRQETSPTKRAFLQMRLGHVHLARRGGDREAHLRLSMQAFQDVLSAVSDTFAPATVGQAHRGLADAFVATTEGDRTQNLRTAINHCQAALRTYPRHDNPSEWALSLDPMAKAYEELAGVDGAESLRRAVDCYRSALEVWTEDAHAILWAVTLQRLGKVYLRLSKYPDADPATWLQVIDCWRPALRVLTARDFPIDFADLQFQMGELYYRHSKLGDYVSNLQSALECFRGALTVWQDASVDSRWLRTHLRLALTHLSLGEHFAELVKKDKTEHQSSAILHLATAVEISRPIAERVLAAGGDVTRDPHLPLAFDIHAQAQSSLGYLYQELKTGSAVENLQAALDCYHSGLRLLHENQHTNQRPNLVAKLALAWREVFRLSGDELRQGGWEREAVCYEARRALGEAIKLKEQLGEHESSETYRRLLRSWDAEDATLDR